MNSRMERLYARLQPDFEDYDEFEEDKELYFRVEGYLPRNRKGLPRGTFYRYVWGDINNVGVVGVYYWCWRVDGWKPVRSQRLAQVIKAKAWPRVCL